MYQKQNRIVFNHELDFVYRAVMDKEEFLEDMVKGEKFNFAWKVRKYLFEKYGI